MPKFDISLAAWSLHKMFFAKEIDQMGMVDFTAKHGITGFEMVNTFFPSPQYAYLKQLKQRADDNNVKMLLIMCDGEGSMASPDAKGRAQAVKNHHKWIDIAAVLGCHSIRCNTGAREGDAEAQDRCAESFASLIEYADANNINVTIENHWGLSSEPDWLVGLMKTVNHPRFGTLPDFGNFPDTIDRYDAVQQMIPFAKALSAKCYDFDDQTGEETKIDFKRMMDIALNAGYSGYVGIEYEGERLSERDGILACKKLLEKLQ